MIGTVKTMNRARTRAGVFLDGFGFAVLLGDNLPVELGDVVEGNLRSLGEEVLLNRRTSKTFAVFIDDFDQDENEIRKSITGY